MYNIPKIENSNIEKAIKFLVEKVDRKDKPVIFHSLKVAFYLLSLGYRDEIIIASILHDCLEDSDCTKEEIYQAFGDKVAQLVSAVSFNPEIYEPEKRYQEMFERTLKFGEKALIIKAADIYDNSHFYYLVEKDSKYNLLIKKLKYFLDLSKPIIGQKQAWKDLYNQYSKIKTLSIWK